MQKSASKNFAGMHSAVKKNAKSMKNHAARKLENARAIAYLEQLCNANTMITMVSKALSVCSRSWKVTRCQFSSATTRNAKRARGILMEITVTTLTKVTTPRMKAPTLMKPPPLALLTGPIKLSRSEVSKKTTTKSWYAESTEKPATIL